MTNDITTTASQDVDLTDEDVCIQHGLSGKKAMMDSARAYVTYHGPIEKWIDKMGLKKSAGYNYRARLLEEGTFKYLQAKPKSDNKKAVQKRKERAQHKATNSTRWKMSPTDDSQSSPTHPLPETSDESPFIERNSTSPEPDSTLVDVEVLQPCSGAVSFSKEVCSTQPEMDKDCPQPSDELVSMDTEAFRQRDADFAECERLLKLTHAIVGRNISTREDPASQFTEHQWQDLSEQYNSLLWGIDIRWQRLRAKLAEDRENYQRRLDQCFGKARDTSDSTVSQLD